MSTFDLIFVLSAVAFNLLIAALFVAQKLGRDKLVRTFGILWLWLIVPLALVFVSYWQQGRETRILVSFGFVFLYVLVELLLDYVFKVDFRAKAISHVPYILLEYVALFSLIVIAFDVNQGWGWVVASSFWILMGSLVYLYWDRIFKKNKASYGDSLIRTLEELSMNAWPDIQTLHYDGWVLRAAGGYTKRANSVYPLYPSEKDVNEKIEFCESFYRDQNLPAVFKLTRASTPTDLDTHLEKRSYRSDSQTSMQTLDLTQVQYTVGENVNLSSEDTETWHAAFARMNNVDESRRTTHKNILHAILPGKCYVSIIANGQLIGCGLGVLQAGYLGIFDIVIDPGHRGQRHGERLVKALLAWGQAKGAQTAYLQVVCNNEPALRLYEKLGFKECYQYWYRIKP